MFLECNACGWQGANEELVKAQDPCATDDSLQTCPSCGNHDEAEGFSEVEYEDADEGYCPHCSGSGEGQHDGSSCWSCGGSGVPRPSTEPDDPPDWDVD